MVPGDGPQKITSDFKISKNPDVKIYSVNGVGDNVKFGNMKPYAFS